MLRHLFGLICVVALATIGASTSVAAPAGSAGKPPLPSSITSRGYIRNLVNTPNPPMEFAARTGGPLTGFDIDLANALGHQMGIPIRTTQTPVFSTLIPSIISGRTDIVLSALTDLKSREQTVSFVDYFRTGNQFLIKKSDAGRFKSDSDLCGQSVVASTGTSYPEIVAALSKKLCAGKAPMRVVQVGSTPEQLLQLATGRAVAVMENVEVVAYQVKTWPSKYAALAKPINPQFYGIIFPKNEPQLGSAMKVALNALIERGTYRKLLAKWNLTAAAIQQATINHGSSAG